MSSSSRIYIHRPPPVPKTVTHVKVDPTIGMIDDETYHYCTSLKTVELPKRLQIIGESAFSGCVALENINIPSSLVEIRRLAFACCRMLESLNLNEGILVIGERAFALCEGMTTMKIPATVNEIGDGAFSACERLTDVELPQGMTTINDATFLGCSALARIKVPDSVVTIKPGAFKNCISLVSVEVSSNLRCIGTLAFEDCASIVSFEIPDSVESIGQRVFNGCSAMTNISFTEVHFADGYIVAQGEDELIGMDKLMMAYPDQEDLLDALLDRFDDLPIHKLCYHQAHCLTVETLDRLKQASEVDIASGGRGDGLGMTPYHIVALSSKPDPHVFSALLKIYQPDILFWKDLWDMTPLDYLCQNEYNTFEAGSIKHLIVSAIADRGQYIGLEKWRLDISNSLYEFSWDEPDPSGRLYAIHKRLERYEILEATSLIELLAWKIKIDDVKSTLIIDNQGNSQKRRWVDRQGCRVNCGAEIVISNVLSFLEGT